MIDPELMASQMFRKIIYINITATVGLFLSCDKGSLCCSQNLKEFQRTAPLQGSSSADMKALNVLNFQILW